MYKNRDDFPERTKHLLARRAGFRCSNPLCRHITIGANSNPQKATNIGVASHITAAAMGGPRYNALLSSEERSSITNAIWLCQTCSVLIDKDPQKYPSEMLIQWKTDSEQKSMDAVNSLGNLFIDESVDDNSVYDFDISNDILVKEIEVRSSFLCDITSLIAKCRNSISWDNRSELKLYSWLNDHSEEDLNELSIRELIQVRKSIIEYLQLHMNMDNDLLTIPFDDYINEFDLLIYIGIHPAFSCKELSEALRVSMEQIHIALKSLFLQNKILPFSPKDNPLSNLSLCKWLRNYTANNKE